ncbi:MAG: 2-amino-4-hydroxy-6-hydroxymethyldihydropteridine diphosphokinase [Candidatus Midichloriaceae bacterium]|jgi:2-amino-4-hydroxy-6-hydroxymethyldihydropteridine diphosphokinase
MQYILGIGTNVGNKIQNIKSVIKLLSNKKSINIIDTSSFYISKPLLPTNFDKEHNKEFINGAVLVEYLYTPESLYRLLWKIEKEMGREKNHKKWLPRIIDLDILIAKDIVVDTVKLQIPHLEFLKRDFALFPACDLAANWIHPVSKKSIAEHKQNIDKCFITSVVEDFLCKKGHLV